MQPPPSLFSPYPQPGEVLDSKYRIERMLGEGGMGAVAKATHLVRRAPVALKFMSPAILSMAGTVERFVNEGVAASQIDSDHVVKVYDVGRLPSGAPYLVMEFLDGRDLSDVITSDGPRIDPTRSVHFTLQMLRALHTAHVAGIVHRDMKPSNCFVIEKDGEPDFLKLVDFGISKVRVADDERASNLTRTNSALGTPLYMSPEQARSPRDVDARSDLYSVGAILYEMLCGRTPYTSETGEYTEILFKIFTTEPEPLRTIQPDVPDGLAEVVHRALLRDREARFSSALDMAEALAPFADERSSDLISRMRGVRGRSIVPGAMPAPSRATPPMPASADVGASPAQTFPQAHADALRAPKVPTDLGLSRSAAGGPRPASRSAAALGILAGVAAVAICIAAGVLVLRNHSAGPATGAGSAGPAIGAPVAATAPLRPIETGATGPDSIVAASPAPPANPTAPSAEASGQASPVTLAPAPSAARPAPSTGPANAEPAPKPSARQAGPAAPTPGSPALPTQLGDLKLH